MVQKRQERPANRRQTAYRDRTRTEIPGGKADRTRIAYPASNAGRTPKSDRDGNDRHGKISSGQGRATQEARHDRNHTEQRKRVSDRQSAQSRSGRYDRNHMQEQDVERMLRKRAEKKRKLKRRRRRIKIFLIVLAVLAVLGGLGYLSTLVFQLKKIQVTGNHYTAEQEVTDWIRKDPYSKNTLYVWWKYNRTEPKELPAVDSVKIKLKSPWEITAVVKEKTFTGRMEFNGENIYFDENGIVSYRSAEVIEGVWLVTGAQTDWEKLEMGEKLPVPDEKVFEKITKITELLQQEELQPDMIGFEDTSLTLVFGDVRVLIGTGGYEVKVKQIQPVLQKIWELYPGQKGELHLENYEQGMDSIRFVPDAQGE